MSRLASDTRSLTDLVEQACAGRRDAWDALVRRLERVVWKAVGSADLSPQDRENAFQNTWLKLFQSLNGVADPERLPGWLATTARREAWRVSERTRRERPDDDIIELDAGTDEPDHDMIEMDLSAALREAFAGLSPRCQTLLKMLMGDPPASYAEIGERLDMDQGSIGPTRGRCLDSLRRKPALATYVGGRG